MSSVARPIPDGHVDLPTIRLGDPAAVWPTTCWHCGSTNLDPEIPNGAHKVGSITCIACSRVQAWLVSGPDPLASGRGRMR